MNVIVGIDPDITTGIAIINMKSELVFLNSSKKYGFGGVVKELARRGSSLIIACDVAKIPEFVQLIASKFEAVLLSPENDLKRNSKNELVMNYEVKFSNYHERDALAAAVYAYKQYESLINKVLKKAGSRIFEPLIRDLVLKRVKNINVGIKKHK